MLLTVAILLIAQALGHSVLGELTVIRPLLAGEVPPLLGHRQFGRDTIRMAWHATTVVWLTQAAVLLALALAPEIDATGRRLLWVIGAGLGLSALWFLVGTRGRHLVWALHGTAAAVCFLS